jgi:catechol 2,3-dioxygenase-like lactoylglutathione lyase family enzyme
MLRPHISIDVQNIEAAQAFYDVFFNATPAKVREGYRKYSLEQPALNFTLNQREHGSSGSLNHLGIEVASTREVLKAKLRLEENGMLPVEEMSTNCCYALQDKIWVDDPDGNSWEIFTVTMSDEDGALPVMESTTCCVPKAAQEAATA